MDYYQSEPPTGLSETSPLVRKMKTMYQSLMDTVTPYIVTRWIGTAALFIIYWVRVFLLQGFHVVSYALAIFLLNRLIGFLSPMIDPDMDPDTDPVLPMKSSEDFRPFLRRLPELKVWNSCTLALLVSIGCTFFSFLDIPVFWPILVLYFLLLFYLTMKRQIMHMIKYRYVPFTYGKPRHQSSTASTSRHH